MRRSIQEIARRHEILRTRFPATDGRPVQVADGALPPIPVVDLEYLTADAREDEARRRAGMEMARSFNLTTGPLVRIFLFRLASTDHVLLFTVHHIAVDGWSLGVLIREVAALYQAFSSGEASPLPEPPIQYADYAIWQRQRLRGKLWRMSSLTGGKNYRLFRRWICPPIGRAQRGRGVFDRRRRSSSSKWSCGHPCGS